MKALQQNENLIAWLFSLSGIPLLVLILWLHWPANAGSAGTRTGQTVDPEQRALILQSIRLKARISICEKALRGESQYRSSCTAAEQKRLPEYREKLTQLEKQLRPGTKNPGPAVAK